MKNLLSSPTASVLLSNRVSSMWQDYGRSLQCLAFEQKAAERHNVYQTIPHAKIVCGLPFIGLDLQRPLKLFKINTVTQYKDIFALP